MAGELHRTDNGTDKKLPRRANDAINIPGKKI
jgi:hypothetical protein